MGVGLLGGAGMGGREKTRMGVRNLALALKKRMRARVIMIRGESGQKRSGTAWRWIWKWIDDGVRAINCMDNNLKRVLLFFPSSCCNLICLYYDALPTRISLSVQLSPLHYQSFFTFFRFLV